MKRIAFKTLASNELFIKLSEGNKKLQPSKKVRYLIWNLPAIVTCPFATEMCKRFCYARKAEKAYPNCLTSRQRNLDISRNAKFATRMIYTINAYMTRDVYKNAENVYVRIHESGDFYSYLYFKNWMTIARGIDAENVQFIAYTKSVVYVQRYINEYGALPKNVSIMSSIWQDTKQKYIDITNDINLPIYTADTEKNVNDAVNAGKAFKCLCENCSTCKACFHGQHKKIYCVIH